MDLEDKLELIEAINTQINVLRTCNKKESLETLLNLTRECDATGDLLPLQDYAIENSLIAE